MHIIQSPWQFTPLSRLNTWSHLQKIKNLPPRSHTIPLNFTMFGSRQRPKDTDEQSILGTKSKSDENNDDNYINPFTDIDFTLLPSQSSVIRERHDPNFDPIAQYYSDPLDVQHKKNKTKKLSANESRALKSFQKNQAKKPKNDDVSKNDAERRLRAKVRSKSFDKAGAISSFFFIWMLPFVTLVCFPLRPALLISLLSLASIFFFCIHVMLTFLSNLFFVFLLLLFYIDPGVRLCTFHSLTYSLQL